MANDAQMEQGLLTADWQALNQEEMIPDKQQRAMIVQKWLTNYIITIGEYHDTGVITVTVAGATFCDRVADFPSVDLFVKLAFAVNSGAVDKLVIINGGRTKVNSRSIYHG
jgi:hypothetical protein